MNSGSKSPSNPLPAHTSRGVRIALIVCLLLLATTGLSHANATHSAGAMIQPGITIDNATTHMRCTLGFQIHDTTTPSSTRQYLTAGHCGTVGDPITATFNNQPGTTIGHITDTHNTDDPTRTWSVITILPTYEKHTSATLAGTTYTPADWMNATTQATSRVDTCAVGSTTGISCGTHSATATPSMVRYTMYTLHGDSGAPFYARTHTGQIIALGILAGSPTGDDSTAIITPLDEVLTHPNSTYELVTDGPLQITHTTQLH